MKRRFFLFAAPAIVAVPSLMKVSALVLPRKETLHELLARRIKEAEAEMHRQLTEALYGDTGSHEDGLAALLSADDPIMGGIDRRRFEWHTLSATIYGSS